MKRQSKGQVALFFLLGIVLIGVVWLLAYAIKSVTVSQTDPVGTAESENYLGQCMENAFYDALDTLAEGEFGDVSVQVRWKHVALGIDSEGAITNTDGMNLPNGKTFIQVLEEDTTDYVSSAFGKITLQPLCAEDGPNARSQSVNPECGRYVYGERPLQRLIEEQLEEALDACTRAETPLATDFSNYGAADVDLIFGSQAVTLQARFANNEEVLSQQHSIRLLSLYNYAYELLVANTKNPTQLIETSIESEHYRPQFLIERDILPELSQYTFTDTDGGYSYRGFNLALRFVVLERPAFTDSDGSVYDPDGIERPEY